MYQLIKKSLFLLDPERAHHLALASLKLAYQLKLFCTTSIDQPVTCFGLRFPNKVGLAAGLDKNGDYIEALAALGFGFIEIGTITPKPQAGNPKPRLFRLVEDEAIINRMGFNSKGMDYVALQLEKSHYRGILGINIGKNRDTSLEKADDDYLAGFKTFWPYASYITINISSPNTPGLRDLQQDELLTHLLSQLKQAQAKVHQQYQKYVPLVVKISPDMTSDDLWRLAQILRHQQIDGIIATNTTITRPSLTSRLAKESGGLSGRPLQHLSTAAVHHLYQAVNHEIPIIAAGGIFDQASAKEKLDAGASLLQIYTGFIYQGPGLIRKVAKTI